MQKITNTPHFKPDQYNRLRRYLLQIHDAAYGNCCAVSHQSFHPENPQSILWAYEAFESYRAAQRLTALLEEIGLDVKIPEWKKLGVYDLKFSSLGRYLYGKNKLAWREVCKQFNMTEEQ